jgi:hypothetical protein
VASVSSLELLDGGFQGFVQAWLLLDALALDQLSQQGEQLRRTPVDERPLKASNVGR